MSKKNNQEKEAHASAQEAPDNVENTEEEAEQTAAPQEATEVNETEQLQAQVAELEDKYLRANAEFENLRKRLEKEKMQAISYAHEQFARDLLPVIDALEIAMGTTEEGGTGKIQEGIALTIEQFKKCFEKHGVKQVPVQGEFNPNVHEAVMQIESEEHESGTIVQAFQKGYTIKDRVLRPAMVSIAK